ncbi:MAG: hypothetical protein LBL94_10075 [Prevotellaceae bacterium]|nr:hypothetical protein [Prevotellaceae bacterium]
MNKVERYIRTALLHVFGVFYAAWLLTRNLIGRAAYRLIHGGFERQTLHAVKKANALAQATGYTYYVLSAGGRVVIKPKRLIKNMLACKGKYFKRGTTIQDIERIALYIAKKSLKSEI